MADDKKSNPLHFVRDGVPCEDQDAARREFIERYGVPIGKEFIRQEIGRVLRKPPENEPAPDISWEEYGRRLAEAVVKLKAEPVTPFVFDFSGLPPKHIDCSKRCAEPEPTCRAGHKLNSVGKCSCDVTPLGLNAKVVREAIQHIANERKPGWSLWHRLAYNVSDDDLLKLWRLLR